MTATSDSPAGRGIRFIGSELERTLSRGHRVRGQSAELAAPTAVEWSSGPPIFTALLRLLPSQDVGNLVATRKQPRRAPRTPASTGVGLRSPDLDLDRVLNLREVLDACFDATEASAEGRAQCVRPSACPRPEQTSLQQ